MGMLVIVKDWGIFQNDKINGMEINTGKMLGGNLVQSAFHQALGDEFTFQQDNNLKTSKGQIYTGVVYQKDSECC
jgi:hypothetical protein